ncbi:MAG TPA: hypothetical protein VHF47_05885 [Acidimicrobiales bacterium]|nr:hypothetical protein [Acidimicrobiales bacterium]
MRTLRMLPWAVRAAWAVLPLTVGPSLAAALDEHADPVRTTASVGLWAAWTIVVVATLVPHPVSLTAVRVAAPGAVVAVAWTTLAGEVSPWTWATVVALCGAAFLPETAAWFVNGPAYPNERRFPLRPPGPVLLAGLLPAWALAVGLPVGGGLLVAAGRTELGLAVLLVGVPVALVLLRAMHGLSRRWVVFVPAGLVLHDGLALVDPVLFQKKVVDSIGLAPAGTDSLDLTKSALGPAVELLLKEKVPMVLAVPRQPAGEPGASARLLFAPTRPGAVLAEAARRGLPLARPGSAAESAQAAMPPPSTSSPS